MVASEPFPRAGVAVVGGECADGQGDGVAERSGMWGGTPNRPATGRNIRWPAPADGGRSVRRRTGGDRTASSSPTAPTPPTGGTPSTGTPPSPRSSRRCAVGAGGGPEGRQELRDCGWRPSRWSAARTARRRPRSRSSRPCTRSTRTRRAATTQRPSTLGSGGFRGVDPSRVGWFPRGRAAASGGSARSSRMRRVGFRWPVVAPSASGGHRAVSADLQTWDGDAASTPVPSGASGELHRTHGTPRRSIRSTRARSPRAYPAPPSRTETTAVWSPGDYSMPPQQVTDTGRHHRRLAPAGW